MPEDDSVIGLSFDSAIRSASVFTLGSVGPTAIASGVNPTILIPARSVGVWKGTFFSVCGEIITGLNDDSSIVWPSGAALATYAPANIPLAPVLFSTTTVVPKTSPKYGATIRAAISFDPPGAKPTISDTGLPCNACADATAGSTVAATPATVMPIA